MSRIGSRPPDTDVLVVGGGPAGLTAALALRSQGLSCRVLDRRHPSLDKPCGEGLMPDGVARLEALGVTLPAGVGHAFHGIRYLDGDVVAEGRFPGVVGLGVRRTALHQALLDRVQTVGIEVRWGARVDHLDDADGESVGLRVGDEVLRARLVVGADGLRSRVRSWAGLDSHRPQATRHRRFGVRRHFRTAPRGSSNDTGDGLHCVEVHCVEVHCVEVHWAEGCEAYVTPVADDEIGVAMLWSTARIDGRVGFDTLLARFPRLADRLAGAEQTSRDRGCGPLLQRARGVARGRVALVGDASGYVDAITGEGLTLAFHHAEALARHYAPALRDESTARLAAAGRAYAREHARIGRLPWTLTRLLLALERRPALRRRAVRARAAQPSVFERFLAVHVGARPARHLGPGAPRLLWGLLGADGG
ncbi:MAG: NAD(P)/FAD-dependent oxidoreductase [Acidobacteriota bacterium]